MNTRRSSTRSSTRTSTSVAASVAIPTGTEVLASMTSTPASPALTSPAISNSPVSPATLPSPAPLISDGSNGSNGSNVSPSASTVAVVSPGALPCTTSVPDGSDVSPSASTVAAVGSDVSPASTMAAGGSNVSPSANTVAAGGSDVSPSANTVAAVGVDVSPASTMAAGGSDVPPSTVAANVSPASTAVSADEVGAAAITTPRTPTPASSASPSSTPVSPDDGTAQRSTLSRLKVKDLKERAKRDGHKRFAGLNKRQLVDIILQGPPSDDVLVNSDIAILRYRESSEVPVPDPKLNFPKFTLQESLDLLNVIAKVERDLPAWNDGKMKNEQKFLHIAFSLHKHGHPFRPWAVVCKRVETLKSKFRTLCNALLQSGAERAVTESGDILAEGELENRPSVVAAQDWALWKSAWSITGWRVSSLMLTATQSAAEAAAKLCEGTTTERRAKLFGEVSSSASPTEKKKRIQDRIAESVESSAATLATSQASINKALEAFATSNAPPPTFVRAWSANEVKTWAKRDLKMSLTDALKLSSQLNGVALAAFCELSDEQRDANVGELQLSFAGRMILLAAAKGGKWPVKRLAAEDERESKKRRTSYSSLSSMDDAMDDPYASEMDVSDSDLPAIQV